MSVENTKAESESENEGQFYNPFATKAWKKRISMIRRLLRKEKKARAKSKREAKDKDKPNYVFKSDPDNVNWHPNNHLNKL